MEFRNLTPFPSIAFDALDQRDYRFHTVAMRITFELQEDGTLALAPVQTPLVTTDEFYGELNRSSIKQESDLAPYKPHTDVIVIGDAWAPQGSACPMFTVAVKICSAPRTPDLPSEPRGLTPTIRASDEQIAEWQKECAQLRAQALQDTVLLHKVLTVKGACEWRQRNPLARALSFFTLPAWKLTAPQPITTLPLRYEYSYGGENKVLVTEPGAKRVGKKHRLAGRMPQTAKAGAANAQEAIAHSVYEANPIGRGFAENWYLDAARPDRIPAPQVEADSEPITRFNKAYPPQGLGVIGRAWRPRLTLAGTYDQEWLEKRHPHLPADFDFAYWNGAPADQQVTPHLSGDETITLVNLCPATPVTKLDSSGNTNLALPLPGHLPFVLVRFQDGRIGELAAKLDTLIVDTSSLASNPQKKIAVVCVWRATVASEPDVRVLEARMLSHDDIVALREQASHAGTSLPPTSAIRSEQILQPPV
ncbi:DUF2169 family type VI secretion system accessory protein [Massilia antarctica]|uniref:DUF2169 family type VI secretion system accessory protein n=1 Tax=Massilia antarctica TaxID=2765360 RepID=UPI002270B55D|nr:DUF2169 domain-containing protein [Massilia sp. H27-R4]MCY0916349.1 DUF2169 domain-containing protein [Massilia sp. H27-R4]